MVCRQRAPGPPSWRPLRGRRPHPRLRSPPAERRALGRRQLKRRAQGRRIVGGSALARRPRTLLSMAPGMAVQALLTAGHGVLRGQPTAPGERRAAQGKAHSGLRAMMAGRPHCRMAPCPLHHQQQRLPSPPLGRPPRRPATCLRAHRPDWRRQSALWALLELAAARSPMMSSPLARPAAPCPSLACVSPPSSVCLHQSCSGPQRHRRRLLPIAPPCSRPWPPQPHSPLRPLPPHSSHPPCALHPSPRPLRLPQ